MRNVLIPTDYSLASLELVEKTVQSFPQQQLNIILFHAFEIPYFDSDMGSSNAKPPYRDIVTDAFRNGCKRLKDQYPKSIQGILLRHLYGNTTAVFHNFIDANEIDLIVFPDHWTFTPVHPQSVNPAAMFRKSGVRLLKTFTAPVQQKEQAPAAKPPVSKQVKTENEHTENEIYAVKKQYSTAVHLRKDPQ
ncbi:hypothetical protein HHL16_17035 [Pseudoflavitalea sp. G-6-1-2]|uniref:hypothetical protein n=1 Tax=Pseudoflavitalea sp. G-6-1-2 TaxID=2728841 RepID=UPI00146B4F90|nr:hypothetical protein [Pseudoflavitalea sp. G-6-1-2]NML22590.1 hypothetical protein [Pseudoflavitalea sp. G-6-1-2]